MIHDNNTHLHSHWIIHNLIQDYHGEISQHSIKYKYILYTLPIPLQTQYSSIYIQTVNKWDYPIKTDDNDEPQPTNNANNFNYNFNSNPSQSQQHKNGFPFSSNDTNTINNKHDDMFKNRGSRQSMDIVTFIINIYTLSARIKIKKIYKLK